MPLWINGIGSCGFGLFYGYMALYIVKRYLPPMVQTSPSIKEIAVSLTTIAGGGFMGSMVREIDGTDFLGVYGLGLVIGAMANIGITIWFGGRRTKRK